MPEKAMTFNKGAVSRWTGPLARGILPAAVLLLAGCERFGEAMTAHTNVVATAEGRELRI
jgi:hypothetical protein